MAFRFVALAALCLSVAARAAGGLSVSPVTVNLTRESPAVVINLRNSGGESKRYQLEMMSWGESPSGQMQLAPTHDVVFFPQLLTLKAGEDRNVRVGITHPAAAVEQTYRLFIQELPGVKPPGGERQVQVLTRVGIPIFVVPPQASSKVELGRLTMARGTAKFTLTNSGTAHARPAKVVFTAANGLGAAVFENSWAGWYLLAHGEREYTVQVPAEACKHATSFRAEVVGEHLSLSTVVQATPGACGT